MDKKRTNRPDLSLFVPVLPKAGPRRKALYAELRRLIEEGQLAPGEKLPTTRDLSARFCLSRGAAVAAYEMLVADGFAEARTGAGTFVARAVPAVTPDIARKDKVPQEPAPPLPGTLGCSSADDTTIATFRRLLTRHLSRPSARHYHYGEAAGGADLRHAVADYLRAARGVRCDPDQVILTSGTQQALDLITRSILRPGDPVWLEDPCYPSARALFGAAGMRIIGVPVDEEGLDPEAGQRLEPKARAVYVTPSHQFPLGVTLSMRRRLALIKWAADSGAWIIEDDYDSEFRFSGPPLTSLQGIDAAGRVLYVGTFSKTLMPGFRLGYLVVPESIRDHILDVRRLTDRFPSTLHESALAEFLRDGHFSAHVRRARRRVRDARDGLVCAFEGSDFQMDVPDQGLHLVARPPAGASDLQLVASAVSSGLGMKALSPMYIDAPPRPGLVIGFSGFDAQVLHAAARRWLESHALPA